jgi:hypothetical protein
VPETVISHRPSKHALVSEPFTLGGSAVDGELGVGVAGDATPAPGELHPVSATATNSVQIAERIVPPAQQILTVKVQEDAFVRGGLPDGTEHPTVGCLERRLPIRYTSGADVTEYTPFDDRHYLGSPVVDPCRSEARRGTSLVGSLGIYLPCQVKPVGLHLALARCR